MATLGDLLVSHLTATVFNRVRQETPQYRNIVSLRSLTLSSRDLTLHNLSKARFTNCIFQDVSFGPLNNVEFAGCTFQSCRFSKTDQRARSEIEIENTLFYLCTFSHTDFDNCRIFDLQFAKSSFSTHPSFRGSRIRGLLRIEECGNWNSFSNLPDAEMRTDWETFIKTDIVVRPKFYIDWKLIRALERIPFLQTSLIGFIFLTIHVYLIEWLFYLVLLPESMCNQLREVIGTIQSSSLRLDMELGRRITELCARVTPDKITHALSWSVGQAMTMFLLLFLAALIHKISSPSEIIELSRTQWVIDQRKPELFYNILAQRRPDRLYVTLVLYVLIAIVFVYTFIEKISVIFHLK